MSFQDLCKRYKEEICSCCMNANVSECEIRKTLNGVKCVNYIKDKSKIKRVKPINCYVEWQV